MSEMRRATWTGLDGRLVLRRAPRPIVPAACEPAIEVEIAERLEPPPLPTLPALMLTPERSRSRS